MPNQRDPIVHIAAVDLMTASKRLGHETDMMCAGMLLALVEVAQHMPDAERWELARAIYATADEVGARTPEWLPKP